MSSARSPETSRRVKPPRGRGLGDGRPAVAALASATAASAAARPAASRGRSSGSSVITVVPCAAGEVT